MAAHRKYKRAEFDKEMIKAERQALRKVSRPHSIMEEAEVVCGQYVRNQLYCTGNVRTSALRYG